MLLNARQVKTVENSSRHILLAIEDITDRKLRDELMRDLNGKLTRSNRELQDFAQVASHDLQEPLRKIQWFGDRLSNAAETVLNDACRGYLERMLNAASRMQSLINDLLMFSRIETKARPFVRTNMGLIASEVVKDLETQIQRTRATVQIESDLPAIEADPLQMRQLLQNLISNALKFNKPDEPPFVIVRHTLVGAALPAVGAGMLCHLMIEDNGIGFDEKYLDRIFDGFQRLHAKAEYDGTGIGLAVCRKIAERHGGSITAKSKPGAGVTMNVALPVHQKKQES